MKFVKIVLIKIRNYKSIVIISYIKALFLLCIPLLSCTNYIDAGIGVSKVLYMKQSRECWNGASNNYYIDVASSPNTDTIFNITLALYNGIAKDKIAVDLTVDSDSLNKAVLLSQTNSAYIMYKNVRLLPPKYYEMSEKISLLEGDSSKNESIILHKSDMLKDSFVLQGGVYVIPLRMSCSNDPKYLLDKKNSFIMLVIQFPQCSLNIPFGYLAESKNGLLFDEEPLSKMYNYAPTAIIDGNNTYIWYCSNRYSNVVGDGIAYRKGMKILNKWYWSRKSFALNVGNSGSWDSRNVCDPSVIKGEFNYKGETYNWLMAYLGCSTIDNSANSFGFAVAKKPDGPWIKVPEVSPLYDFYKDNPGYVYNGTNQFLWGTGQPSIISVDKKGRILLFYTGGSYTGQMAERWDFTDLENPQKEFAYPVSYSGIKKLSGEQDGITNADFVYDNYNKRFLMTADTHPWDPVIWPINLPYSSQVAYLADINSNDIGTVFYNSQNKSWTNMIILGEKQTGFKRNHNTGFFRDPYGWLYENGTVDLGYTISQTGDSWLVLWTYRIYRYNLNLTQLYN